MNALDSMFALLTKILSDPQARKATIEQFQSQVWDPKGRSIDEDTRNILADLAYDLDFFESDPALRKEDPSYYGHERLEEEVETAFRRLAELGILVPRNPTTLGE
jgi:hypothetical protein